MFLIAMVLLLGACQTALTEAVVELDEYPVQELEQQEPIPMPVPSEPEQQEPARNEEDAAPDSPTTNTWREAYVELLRYYAVRPLAEMEAGWHFALHDIDRNGTPQLFIAMRYHTGHMSYRYVHSFAGGAPLQLEFENRMTDGGILVPLDDSSWIIFFGAVGSGGIYEKLVIDGERVVVEIASDFFHLTYEGFERSGTLGLGIDSYEWYILSIDGNPVTVEAFESVFGGFSAKKSLEFLEITEANIQDINKYEHKAISHPFYVHHQSHHAYLQT